MSGFFIMKQGVLTEKVILEGKIYTDRNIACYRYLAPTEFLTEGAGCGVWG